MPFSYLAQDYAVSFGFVWPNITVNWGPDNSSIFVEESYDIYFSINRLCIDPFNPNPKNPFMKSNTNQCKYDLIWFNTSNVNPMPRVNMATIATVKIAFTNFSVSASCLMLKDRETVHWVYVSNSRGSGSDDVVTSLASFPSSIHFDDILFIAYADSQY